MRLETKFQDKDFDFGEIVKAKVTTYYDENKVVVMADKSRGGISRFEYNSIKDFTDHWEDYEEPKEYYWVIDEDGVLVCREVGAFVNEGMCKQIGNYFTTEEEAKKAVDKLKAWKRLKCWGFKFCGEGTERDTIEYSIARPPLNREGYWTDEIHKCFDLLFGGEE